MTDPMRPLTNGEEMLVARVFGQADFNWCPIRIVRGAHPMAQGRGRQKAHTWQDRMYFPLEETDYAEDFSRASPWKQVTFIHEFAHCWQHLCSIGSSIRSRVQKAMIDDGLRTGYDKDGKHHRKLGRDTYTRLLLDEARQGKAGWTDGISHHTKRLNGFFENDTTAYSCGTGAGPARKLGRRELVASNRGNADYNYLHHDLRKIDFFALNGEEQAALVTDYFCLVMGYAPEVYCWYISPAKRPPVDVYKGILPFPT